MSQVQITPKFERFRSDFGRSTSLDRFMSKIQTKTIGLLDSVWDWNFSKTYENQTSSDFDIPLYSRALKSELLGGSDFRLYFLSKIRMCSDFGALLYAV